VAEDRHIGFLGLTLSIEDLSAVVNLYVLVEFVFLHPTYRTEGLSRHFHNWVVETVRQWMKRERSCWSGRHAILYTA
jgi:hypothetical protein